jgi:hypothetical protein
VTNIWWLTNASLPSYPLDLGHVLGPGLAFGLAAGIAACAGAVLWSSHAAAGSRSSGPTAPRRRHLAPVPRPARSAA